MARTRLARRHRVAVPLLMCALAACTAPPDRGVAPDTAPLASAAPSEAAESRDRSHRVDRGRPTHRVLAISVDGLNPVALRRLGPAGAPTYHQMMRRGASTLQARTAVESTETLPNHATMLTGRRVDARRGGHGTEVNEDPGVTMHDLAGEYVASVFDVVHDAGGGTALFASKPKFRFLDRTWRAGDGAAEPEQAADKIDHFALEADNEALVALARADLRNNPRDFTFLHLSLPDEAGHERGYLSRPYLAAVRRTDALLGSLLRVIRRQTELRDGMVVLLTSDHGGVGVDHDDPRDRRNYRVPFLSWGAGVPAGTDLYALNPSLRRPGPRQPGYRGRQPIRNGFLANATTDLLDLPRVPGSELDVPRTFRVTDP